MPHYAADGTAKGYPLASTQGIAMDLATSRARTPEASPSRSRTRSYAHPIPTTEEPQWALAGRSWM